VTTQSNKKKQFRAHNSFFYVHVLISLSISIQGQMTEGEEVRPKTLIRAQGPCPVCLTPRIKKKERVELACGHVFCRSCVHIWAQHLILYRNTKIFCMELSCGIHFTTFWTHTGNKYLFSPEKGCLPVQKPTVPKTPKEERFREHLRNRLDQVEKRMQNEPVEGEPFVGGAADNNEKK